MEISYTQQWDEQFTQLTAVLGEHGTAALMTILKKSGALDIGDKNGESKAKPNGDAKKPEGKTDA